MPTTLDFSETLENFYTPVTVIARDMEGAYVGGAWEWNSPEEPREIQAVVLTLSVQTLYFYKEANVAAGGIAILTQEELFFTDMAHTDAEQNKQSIVEYQGRRFRVVGDGFTSGYGNLLGNANFNCYNALRYVE